MRGVVIGLLLSLLCGSAFAESPDRSKWHKFRLGDLEFYEKDRAAITQCGFLPTETSRYACIYRLSYNRQYFIWKKEPTADI